MTGVGDILACIPASRTKAIPAPARWTARRWSAAIDKLLTHCPRADTVPFRNSSDKPGAPTAWLATSGQWPASDIGQAVIEGPVNVRLRIRPVAPKIYSSYLLTR